MDLSGAEDRLFPDHTFPFHFPVYAVGFDDVPVTAQELDGHIAFIFNGYLVSMHVAMLERRGFFRQIIRFDTYFDALGRQCFHDKKEYL